MEGANVFVQTHLMTAAWPVVKLTHPIEKYASSLLLTLSELRREKRKDKQLILYFPL